ncbi:nucleoside-diphosphate sugar epimerase, partial [Intrasporangium oryzae NRRL B-24470]
RVAGLVAAAAAAGAAGAAGAALHLVHISIVGIDAMPMRYYRRKLAAERAIETTGAPATVLRATQFHSLAAFFARALTKGPLTFPIGRMALQPVDTDFVATRLVDLALGPGPAAYRRATDVAGPDVLPVEEIAALVRARQGLAPPRVMRLPAVGATMRALDARHTIADPAASETGGRRFVDWLADQPVPLTGR